MAGEKDSKVQLAELMYGDEEMRPLMDGWAEKHFPGTQARMATSAAVSQGVAQINKAREEFRVEVEQARAMDARSKNIAAIQRDPNLRFREDEIPALEKFMVERGIGNYEDAAYRYRQINQVAAPSPRGVLNSVEITGLNGGGGDDGSWLKSAFRRTGTGPVDLSELDRITKKRVNSILADFDRDPVGASQRWA